MRHSPVRCLVKFAVAAAILGCAVAPLRALDDEMTREIWRLKYGVSSAQAGDSGWLAQDADGDGATNGEELAAGTNPLSPSTTIRVTSVVLNGGNAELTFPTEAGKRYRAECSPSLTTPNYTLQPPGDPTVVTGNGGPMMISVPHPGDCFYRVRVDDVDTDGDGLADWLEQATGLNPNTPELSPGVPDTTDFDFVEAQLALPNEVNILAEKAFASEDGPTAGMFKVTRKQKLLPLTVSYNTSGTATPGSDYSALPGTVNFAAGADTMMVGVNPMQNAPSTEGSESVTATLVVPGGSEPPYVLGANDEATVIINDSAAPAGTGLLAEYFDTASSTYSNSANFNAAQLKITRVDPVVDNDWVYGTPNDVAVTPGDPVDNYSTVFEGYLHPTSSGNYRFQLDADDKARVLIDLNNNGTFDLPGEQIVEHGWDTSSTGSPEDGVADDETIGTFKQTGDIALTTPAGAAQRYRIRVEHVETTGAARCRLQWRVPGSTTYANIPSAQVFAHVRALTNYTVSSQVATINTAVAHGLTAGNSVTLYFSSGILFTPPANYSGTYSVASVVDADTFTISVPGASNQTSGAAGFMADSTSTTAGWLDRVFTNTTFTAPAGRVGVLAGGATNANNGIWGSGTPDPALIHKNTFSIRWTGQVQPQFSEEYTFVVHADDGFRMWINGEEQELRQTLSSNVGGSTYTYVNATGQATVTYTNSSIVAGQVAVGDVVRLDPTAGTLTSLGTTDLVVTQVDSPTVFRVSFPTGFGDQTTEAGINFDALNREIKPWASNGNERYVRIPMIGGVRYDLRLEYYENTGYSRCRLFWYSASQPKQIIPSDRLYPANGTFAPAAHITPSDATALVGGAFSLAIAGSNNGSVSLTGNPAWLSFAGGVLSGTPPPGAAGDYQILITITNANGTSTSVVNLRVEDTGSSIAREYWNGVAGTSVTDIPTGTAPTGTEDLTSLEAPTDFGDDYGARIRGYITAPETGNYYFWIAASDAAELWVSNDDEPINAFKRAWVSAGTASQQWNAEANQQSPWLALEQGRKYYVEILHKAGAGAGDNLAVGWSKPGQSAVAPSEVVPGYVLSAYTPPAPGSSPGTLYVATMLSQGGAITNGVGVATLVLSDDETVAYVKFDDAGFTNAPYNGLTGAMTDWHVHSDPYLTHASAIIYDGTEPLPGDGPQPDGSHKWNITGAGTLSAAEIIELLKQGKAYINLHTAAYPNGEIRGNFTLAAGSRTFTPPPPPPAWADDSGTDAGAARFLTQASYGPSVADITALKALSPSSSSGFYTPSRYEVWIDDQFTKSTGLQLPEVMRTEMSSAQGGAFDETLTFNAWWWRSIAGEDQLRQRIAFALSEIHVVSAQGPLDNNARALSYFYDKLADNAFGNFRDIIEDTTLTPTMGRYLDMLRNDKPDQAIGRIPNENYAREIKQLFSIGLYRMWPDGTLMLSSKSSPIDTYTQREIIGFSHVFTGWDYGYDGAYRTALNAPADWTRQMREVPARHYTGTKRLLNNEVLPGLAAVGSQTLDPLAVHNSMHINDPAFQALPAQELDVSHDQLFNHPNTGPFICRQLIQRLVTSHPSRDYLYRVVSKFNDNGSGVRGDMKAVIKAILLDYEARSPDLLGIPAYGKQREPVMRVAAAARAFRKDGWTGNYSQSGTRTITITTDTPHGFSGTSNQFLDFTSGSPAPWIGSYSTALGSPSATTLTVQAQGWATSTGTGYSIPANSSECTVTMSNHWLQVGHEVFVDFTSGGANGVAGLDQTVYTVTDAPVQTGTNIQFKFQIDPGQVSASARTGNCMIPRFNPGSYTSASSGLPAPNDRRVTMDTIWNHELEVGDQVQLNFFGGNPQPVDMVATVESIVDLNTWTFTAPASGTNLGTNQGNNSVYQFPLKSLPLNRSGTVVSRSSTFAMGNTTANLEQSPLNSPTVFNFFLPDYKFPGSLASQGITTPEFQETAETTVIRQANFIYSGIFNPNQSFLSSFTSGDNDLIMDFAPWMPADATDLGLGPPTNATVPWTHNQNIVALIDRLSTLLMAGQLSSQAKTMIRNFVSLPLSSISTGNPCTVTTAEAHQYRTGDLVCISGVANGSFSPTLNSTTTTHAVTVTGPTTFTIPVNCTTAPTGLGLANAHVSPVIYNQGSTTPSDANKRDRVRSIIHFILTSPDFTIQR